jgi:hypothetical protein
MRMSSNEGNPISEVETFLKKMREGEFEIDNAHPDAKVLSDALDGCHAYKMASASSFPLLYISNDKQELQ